MTPQRTTNVKISLSNQLLDKFEKTDMSLTQLLNKLLADHIESKNRVSNANNIKE